MDHVQAWRESEKDMNALGDERGSSWFLRSSGPGHGLVGAGEWANQQRVIYMNTFLQDSQKSVGE